MFYNTYYYMFNEFYYMSTRHSVGSCLATKSLNFINNSGMGGGDTGCGSRLLGVTSNKQVTFP